MAGLLRKLPSLHHGLAAAAVSPRYSPSYCRNSHGTAALRRIKSSLNQLKLLSCKLISLLLQLMLNYNKVDFSHKTT